MSYAIKYQADLDAGGFEKKLVEYRRRHLVKILASLRAKNIVEIGCGTEPIFCWFDSFNQVQVIERSKEFCENAHLELKKIQMSKVGSEGLNVHIDNIAFEECHNFLPDMDFVVLSSVLHEVDDPKNFLSHLKSLLRGNEHVYINVPNANSLHRLLAFHAGMINSTEEISARGNFFQTKRVFTNHTLSELVKSCGFDILDSGSVVLKPFTHAQMAKIFDLDDVSKNESLFDALFYADKVTPGMGSEIWMLIKARG